MPDPEREIHRLHEVIEAWFRGETDDLSPFADALAPEFAMVSPDGTRRDRDEVLERLRGAHGSRATDPEFAIDVRAVQRRAVPGDAHLLTYEEHQHMDGGRHGRVSTVLLRPSESAPAGLAWVHLHETWLEG